MRRDDATPARFSWARLLWIALLSVVQLESAVAQVANPTPEQLEAFRSMTPEQQRAVLEAASSGNGSSRTERAPEMPTLMQPRYEQQEAPVPVGPDRLAFGSALLLNVEIKTEENARQPVGPILVDRRQRILARNPYRLDEEGRLTLPFLPPIGLAGLTEEQAAQRLTADARLSGLNFEVTLLPVELAGVEALKPFGYDLFDQVPTTFAPATDIPVPPDYRVGPGDTVVLELFGQRTERSTLVVDRNGSLNLPGSGPLQVTGLTFDQLTAEIEKRIAEQMMGVRASVTMGQLRSIRVFVVGDARRPGNYTVSGLSTMTNALFASGGIANIGSLRNIELKRGSTTVGRLDLYDLLLRGDGSKDLQLRNGDVIFVPPIGPTVRVSGKVTRPAIYELRGKTTVEELLKLAGGPDPEADPRAVRLERIDADLRRVVLNLDLTTADRQQTLQTGDLLVVPRVLEDFTRSVSLEGHVARPGRSAWWSGMTLTDLLGSLDAFKLSADQRYVLIRREHMPDRRIEILSADATRAFRAKRSSDDPALQSGDRIVVFSMQRDRGTMLNDVLQELRLQTRDSSSPPIVTINGRVRAPGAYPLENGMTVSDLLRAGGGLDEAAYGLMAELTRFEVAGGDSRQTEVRELKLSQITSGASAADVVLQPYDLVVIKETPDWHEQGSIQLKGEVRFPGTYPVRKGETLSSVIDRAGGLTDHAFADGAVFMREEIKVQERQQIDSLAGRMQMDLGLVALQGAQSTDKNQNPAETLAIGQSLLTQLRATQPTGRLVINLQTALAQKGSDEDIQLRDGDVLVVPPLRQYVTVIGEVQNPTSHVWRRGRDEDEYVQMSGGLTSKADEDRIYVVRANGSVVPKSGGGLWFSRSKNVDMQPGDTVVAPLDAERMRPLSLWTAVSTIIYNSAVAVAAIGAL